MKKLKFLIGKTEYQIGFWSGLSWIILHILGVLFGFEVYPIGYFMKLSFGIFGATIIVTVAWFWLEKTVPELKKQLDPDDNHYKGLVQWEKVKLGFWYFALYVISAVLLASLY